MLFPQRQPESGPRRVVVTGAGILTALGNSWTGNARGFQAGARAFRPVRHFAAGRQRVQTAAEVDLPSTLPSSRLSSREEARLDRAARMLLIAGADAFEQSGWEMKGEISTVLGTTCGGMPLGQDYYRAAKRTPSARRLQPTRSVYYQAQRQGALPGRAFGFGGAVTVIANACASGANAVGHAWELVRHGGAERVLAGGYDALCELVYAGFDSLQALTPGICRPFDRRRDGLALGEGAALFALETLESARERGARILGEIRGYAAATDGHHLTQPHPGGNAAFATMTRACELAGLKPAGVDYLNAHGTGTPLNDASEAAAINRWAADSEPPPVSSTKASVGHLLGAAGAVEVAVCLMALEGQWLPPTTTCEETDEACGFRIVSKPEPARVENVLTNSFGFGGANASLVIGRCP